MKVFISWSGTQSKAIASALRDWLPDVLQAVRPWMSEEDIGKGTRWAQEIGEELADSKVGIICLTPDNLKAEWINFEAGAISKTLENTFVCTYLYGLKPTDVQGPLALFNHTVAAREDTLRLVNTLNKALEAPLGEQQLNRIFGSLWPQFEDQLRQIPERETTLSPRRSSEAMIEEILALVRALSSENVFLLKEIQEQLDKLSREKRLSSVTEEVFKDAKFPPRPVIAEAPHLSSQKSRPGSTMTTKRTEPPDFGEVEDSDIPF